MTTTKILKIDQLNASIDNKPIIKDFELSIFQS